MDIILIGMPGCGKTTIGRDIARRTGRKFIDTDALIEQQEGRKISDIFAENGEAYFRELETENLRKSLGRGCVISTGGGIVVRGVNIEILKNSNAAVVFIDRPIDNIMSDIDTGRRPLLADGAERIRKLYDERYGKYKSACNIHIINDRTREAAVNKIIREVKSYENNGCKRS